MTAVWRLLSAFKERKRYKRFSVSAPLCISTRELVIWIQMRWAVQNGEEIFQYASGDASLKVVNDIQTLIHCSQISVVQIVIHPRKESYWLFFFFLSLYTFLSPGYKSSYAIGRRNEGCIWYCYKSLINQAGLGVSQRLQCHVAAASICCGQKLHAGGSVVEGTDGMQSSVVMTMLQESNPLQSMIY